MKNTIHIAICLILTMMIACTPYNKMRKQVNKFNCDSIQIVKKDGATYLGKALLPKKSCKTICIQTDSEDELTVISKDIEYIRAWHRDLSIEKSHKFIYTNVKEYETLDLNNNNQKQKLEPRWLLEVKTENNLTMYAEYQEYDIKNEGRIDGRSKGVVSIPPSIWYYLKSDTDKYPVCVALDKSAGAASKKYFKNMGQKYFSNYPEIAEKIKCGEIGFEKIEKIMAEYKAEYKRDKETE